MAVHDKGKAGVCNAALCPCDVKSDGGYTGWASGASAVHVRERRLRCGSG